MSYPDHLVLVLRGEGVVLSMSFCFFGPVVTPTQSLCKSVTNLQYVWLIAVGPKPNGKDM